MAVPVRLVLAIIVVASAAGRSQTIDSARVPRLLHGFNQFLGSHLNLTFFDTAVVESLKVVPTGALRYPGGSIANFWNMSAAQYVVPYNPEWTNIIDGFPAQSFSPGNFFKAMSPHFIGSPGTSGNVVFDLNIMTLDGDDLLRQVDTLIAEVPDPHTNVRHLELGNEYYLINQYHKWFNTSAQYMQKATPLINYIRKVLPQAKIAAVTSSDTNPKNAWNAGVAQYAHLFDAVTIHDYSLSSSVLKGHSVGNVTAWMVVIVAHHGINLMPRYASYVRTMYGSDKTIWMTEFNVARGFTEDFLHSGLHAMFVLNYLFASMCLTDGTVDFIMMHVLSSQKDNWSQSVALVELPRVANSPQRTQYTLLSQVYAQMAHLGVLRHSTTTCVSVPQPLALDGKPCIHGALFTTPAVNGAGATVVVVNACPSTFHFTVPDVLPNQRSHSGATVQMTTYYHSDTFSFSAYGQCTGGGPLWDAKGCPAGYQRPHFYNGTVDIVRGAASLQSHPFSVRFYEIQW